MRALTAARAAKRTHRLGLFRVTLPHPPATGRTTAAAAATEVSSWATSAGTTPPLATTSLYYDDEGYGNCSCDSVDVLRAQLTSFNITPEA